MVDLTHPQVVALKSIRWAVLDNLKHIHANIEPGSEAVVAPCVVAMRGIIRHCEVLAGAHMGRPMTVGDGWSPDWQCELRDRLVQIEAALGAA